MRRLTIDSPLKNSLAKDWFTIATAGASRPSERVKSRPASNRVPSVVK
jgi:hypothetical protein